MVKILQILSFLYSEKKNSTCSASSLASDDTKFRNLSQSIPALTCSASQQLWVVTIFVKVMMLFSQKKSFLQELEVTYKT